MVDLIWKNLSFGHYGVYVGSEKGSSGGNTWLN